ncbi:tyrosine--tRNA ligase [Mycoplasma ovis]|uniref:tyrosine--tRNA ligase n=1 Tax=Mycoplasma ovis TaxID=171632 RepID=UPI001EEF0E08|nr:tyrosine--tRNA ligase [Mycoplasma ovis]
MRELKSRGVLYNSTPIENLEKLLDSGWGIYVGFDLTANSLHWGHYLLLAILNRASEYQIPTVIVIGDFTTPIGDASWRADDRKKITNSELSENLEKIREQLKRLSPNSELIQNSQFYSSFSINSVFDLLPFFNANSLLNKDFLKMRWDKESLTLKDIFYPVLQSYDFYSLVKNKNIGIQLGGQDQWGNITTGIEFIKRKQENLSVGGFTIPLLTDSSGSKFGKSTKGALFLDNKLSSEYKVFQYFWNLSDQQLKNLSNFVFSISLEELELPPQELKQKIIRELFTNVYSLEKFQRVQKISDFLFDVQKQSENYQWTQEELELLMEEIPSYSSSELMNVSNILIQLGLSNSHSESKRLVEQDGCIFGFGKKLTNHKEKLDISLFQHSFFLIRKGEKDFGIFKLITN